MRVAAMNFLPEDRQIFQPARSLGDALAQAVRAAWPHHTAKTLETRWNFNPSSADNTAKGLAGAVLIYKAVKAEGWALWMALGELIIGHSFDEHLEELANEHARLQQEAAERRSRVRRVLAGPPDRADLAFRSDDSPSVGRPAERRTWDRELGGAEEEELGPPNLDLFEGPLQ